MSTHVSQPVSRVWGWLGQSTFERVVTVIIYVATITYAVGTLAHWWSPDALGWLLHYLIGPYSDSPLPRP